MRISVKGRYALASAICMAQDYERGELLTVASISGRLGISKIYLEQVFSLLRRSGLVLSIKGAQGGYQLQRPPWKISVYEVLSAVELSMFEDTEATVEDNAPEVEQAMRTLVYTPLSGDVRRRLSGLTLQDLAVQVEENRMDQGPMFYI